MTSIIRLKRPRDEDPIENLMVTCKKFKHEGELQTTCQLTFAGTAKSENDCMRVVRNALQLEVLDKNYATSVKPKKALEVSKKGTKRARPAEDLEVVSSVGAENIDNLFQSKRAKLESESSEKSRYRLVDVEKKSKDLPGDCVYDVFYIKDPNVACASPDVINFFVRCEEDICDRESEDEETKEEINLEMNYFDDDVEEENYWSKDYPDEFNVFYEKDEDEDDKSNSDDDDDGREQDLEKELQNDYGEYMEDFVNRITKSEVVTKGRKDLMKSARKMLEKCSISKD